MEASEATLKPAFMDTSPALTTEPVKEGEARGAFSARALVNPVLTIDPPTYKLPLKELSDTMLAPELTTNPAEFIVVRPVEVVVNAKLLKTVVVFAAPNVIVFTPVPVPTLIFPVNEFPVPILIFPVVLLLSIFVSNVEPELCV